MWAFRSHEYSCPYRPTISCVTALYIFSVSNRRPSWDKEMLDDIFIYIIYISSGRKDGWNIDTVIGCLPYQKYNKKSFLRSHKEIGLNQIWTEAFGILLRDKMISSDFNFYWIDSTVYVYKFKASRAQNTWLPSLSRILTSTEYSPYFFIVIPSWKKE